MELKFQVQTKIQKPVNEVFDAVYNPEKLNKYFIKSSTGPLDEGTTVLWNFPEMQWDMQFPVIVKKVVKNELIVLEWQAQDGEYNTTVEMVFEPLEDNSTFVKISESGWKETEEGLKSSYSNCQGWMHMSCSLKAYIEYGINLRQGSF